MRCGGVHLEGQVSFNTASLSNNVTIEIVSSKRLPDGTLRTDARTPGTFVREGSSTFPSSCHLGIFL